MVISVAALMMSFGGYFITEPQSIDTGQSVEDVPDGNGEVISDITSITVPEMKINDQALYDYELFAQMYSENYSSGEWERYTFSGEGSFLQYIDEISTVEDGFGTRRKAVRFGYETKASFRVKIERSGSDDVTIPGNLDVERSEFRNLFDRHALKATNSGMIGVDNLGTAFGNVPANVEYNADLKTYPIPSQEPVQTLDESIYGGGRILRPTSKGSYIGDPFYEEENRVYNWSVDGAFKVKEHDTFKINVTSNLWNWIFFERHFYISEDSPFPLKGTTRTNTSAYWDEGEFYLILETSREIKEGESGLVSGDNPIPWGDVSGHEEYDVAHPAGEYDRWDYGPADGTDLERSSFNGWTQEDAIEFAKENSPELNDFLEEYEGRGKVMIADSVYNTSKEDRLGRNSTQWWNLTFSYVFDLDELIEYYEDTEEAPYWRYRLLVARSTDETIQGSTVSTFISRDEGDDYHGTLKAWWGEGIMKDNLQLNSRILTLTHSEKILKLDSRVKANAFENGRIKDDIQFYYGIVGITDEQNPGLVLIEQLTGISTPTANNAFGFQNQNIWESGTTFSAAVDANTGQMLYVTSVEGSQLAAIFGGA
jgi:hypothetical protein